MSALDSPHGRPAYKAVGRMVCDTLHLGDLGAFEGLAVVLRARLTPEERWLFAWAALRACRDEGAIAVAEAVIPQETRAGWPLVPLFDAVDEAAIWADHASLEELRTYLMACFRALPPVDQGEFLGFVQRRIDA